MEHFKELFEKYKEGILEDTRIEELNKYLVEIYFSSPGKLNLEELEYTEDLVFELYARNDLEEKYAQRFKEKIENNNSLNKRYILQKNLAGAERSNKSKRFRHLMDSEETDEKEEAQLKEVLQEVIEKAHAEIETSPLKDRIDNLIANLKNIFRQLIAPVVLLQPQVKFALVLASLAGVAVIVWFSVNQRPEMLTADKTLNDTVIDNQIPVIDSGSIQITPGVIDLKDPGDLMEEQIARNDRQVPAGEIRIKEEAPQLARNTGQQDSKMSEEYDGLLASFYEPPGFEYNLSRGETTDAIDLFVLAADKYNGLENGEITVKDYERCIIILRELLNKKAFKDKDTLNEIQFFLGNCFLAKGIEMNSDSLLQSALQSFESIDRQDRYYQPSLWYRVFAYVKLGQPEESLKLCNMLINLNYLRMGEVEALRDSLYNRIGN